MSYILNIETTLGKPLKYNTMQATMLLTNDLVLSSIVITLSVPALEGAKQSLSMIDAVTEPSTEPRIKYRIGVSHLLRIIFYICQHTNSTLLNSCPLL